MQVRYCHGNNMWAVFYSGDHNTHTHTLLRTPRAISAKKKKKKRFRAISLLLTAGLPSLPRQQWEKDSSGIQVMLPLICLQSHEPNRNRRWMKGEHLNADTEGFAEEGADPGKVSKWIPLRHLREQWGAFSPFLWFLANFLPILLFWIPKSLSLRAFSRISVLYLLRPNLSEIDTERGHKKLNIFSGGKKYEKKCLSFNEGVENVNH